MDNSESSGTSGSAFGDLFRARSCRCEHCCEDPLPTYTEKFRHECEVRDVVAMSSHAARADYLAEVQKKRGINAATRLRESAWRAMKEAA